MGDVNKGVWPSEVRRSNDVNKNNIDPPPPKKCNKKNPQTTINVGQNDRVWKQWVVRNRVRLTLSPRGPLPPVRPCGGEMTQSDQNTEQTLTCCCGRP